MRLVGRKELVKKNHFIKQRGRERGEKRAREYSLALSPERVGEGTGLLGDNGGRGKKTRPHHRAGG